MSDNPGPQDVISYRDAQDRIANLGTNDEAKAVQLFDSGQLSGDNILAAAVVSRALEADWANVANSYIEAHPYYGAMVEELWYLNQHSLENENNLGKAFENSLAFHLEKPSELGMYNLHSQIQTLADSDK
ncbi:hypothetical protein [Arthrobacter sp. NicSoilB8]|uniref:hypothetical protein n=1 Tax=Arthrobacter sp. NicSoilB8 TaxID=2830998 RepID=UPI001CC4E0E0|nr:hypothetical protein [Arthrobacter sp. NicSoilB8]